MTRNTEPTINQSAISIAAICLLGTILALMGWGCGAVTTIRALEADPNLQLADALSQTSVADLDAAYADALAHDDKLAIACYPVLKSYLGKLGGDTKSKPIGVFSSYQRARDVRLVVGDLKIPDDLRLACSAMVQESKDFALKIIAISHP